MERTLGFSRREIIFLIALVAVSALAWAVWTRPIGARASRLRTEAESLSRQVQNKQVSLSAAQARKERRDTIQASLDAIHRRILPPDGLPKLLGEISQQAMRAQVRIVSMTPKAPQTLGGQLPYQQLPVSLSIQGTYRQLGEFLEGISRGPVMITMREAQVTSVGKKGFSLTMRLELAAWIWPRGAEGKP
ncbi:MAG: type 4a pilus biogenesis protein PilO [Candidatus Methylomirabilales bacterium]